MKILKFVIKMIRSLKNILLIFALFFLVSCKPNELQLKKVIFSGPMMGTQYRIIVLLNKDSESQANEIESSVIEAMNLVNQSMSSYLPDSELNRINNAGNATKLVLSDGMFEVINESLEISELSDGAFDITIAPAVNLWGFGPGGKITEFPDDQMLAKIKQRIGYKNIQLDGRSIIKGVPNLSLDLSAIAKGFAVDQVAELLNKFGIENYLIDIGGELRGAGLSQDNKTWTVGIEKPHTLGSIQQAINLPNKSIATSGDYRNYHIIDGKQFSHTIDAKTLKPVFHRLALVSVIDDRASRADALATTIMAMGDEKGWAFAKQNNLIVYMIIREDEKNSYRVKMTENFKYYLQ